MTFHHVNERLLRVPSAINTLAASAVCSIIALFSTIWHNNRLNAPGAAGICGARGISTGGRANDDFQDRLAAQAANDLEVVREVVAASGKKVRRGEVSSGRNGSRHLRER